MLAPQDFFDLIDFDHQGIFLKDEAVWTALDRSEGLSCHLLPEIVATVQDNRTNREGPRNL